MTVVPMLVPADVSMAASATTAALRPLTGRDWTIPAGDLDWDIRTTLGHAAGATAKYGLTLASRSARFVALRTRPYDDATNDDLLHAVAASAAALEQMAEASGPDARGYHVAGMADAEGFIAMACVEILVHGYDAAAGVGTELHPPEDLCAAVLARLFPWVQVREPAWETLLWACDRIDLPGISRPGPGWVWHCAPLDEWDGTVPALAAEPALEYRLDPSTGQWRRG